MNRLTNSRLADAVKSDLFIPYDEFEEIKETMRTTREPSFNEIYCKLAEYEDKEEKQDELLEILKKYLYIGGDSITEKIKIKSDSIDKITNEKDFNIIKEWLENE